MSRKLRLGLALVTASVGCRAAGVTGPAVSPPAPPPAVAPAPPPALPQGDDPSLASLVDKVRPGVLLILNHRKDGAIGYGAGFLADPGGLVLTSRHVVAGASSLSALLYRPGRDVYTPMDGGLARVVFENHKELLPARVMEEDEISDLAVLRVDGDTSRVPVLSFANEPVHIGERIVVFGHPQEAAWSFTAGFVNGLPQNAIQHDATVGEGSSGGPVIDMRGRVVGINVAKVLNMPRGFAFARPISLASAWVAQALASRAVDLSTPERGAVSCWHAYEFATPELVDCFDWAYAWSLQRAALNDLEHRIGRKLAARAMGSLSRDEWILNAKARYAKMLREGARCPPQPQEPPQEEVLETELGRERERARSEMRERSSAHASAVQKNNGIKSDISSKPSLVKMLKMGIRVEEVRQVTDDLAWVLFAGRNTDGTPYHFAEAWARSNGRWLQRSPPSPSDRAKLPADWPPPIEDYELSKAKMLVELFDEVTSGISSDAGAAAPEEGGCSKATPSGAAL